MSQEKQVPFMISIPVEIPDDGGTRMFGRPSVTSRTSMTV